MFEISSYLKNNPLSADHSCHLCLILKPGEPWNLQLDQLQPPAGQEETDSLYTAVSFMVNRNICITVVSCWHAACLPCEPVMMVASGCNISPDRKALCWFLAACWGFQPEGIQMAQHGTARLSAPCYQTIHPHGSDKTHTAHLLMECLRKEHKM